jgi:hypothetical protein
VLPSGLNPSWDTNAAKTVTDAETGVVLGHRIPTGKGNYSFVKAALPDNLTAAQRLRALTSQYTSLVAIPTDENKKLAAEVHAEIQGLMKGGGKGGSAEALPMPKTKGELKSGQQYQTGRGVATWNGTQFVQ